jgi:predicted O-linked N-acetylglucosamine transferase (SPINDLY family)
MDYIVADTILIPEQNQRFYSEKIIYLPHCYQPQDILLDNDNFILTRTELGLPEDRFIFCCFNNSYKISSREFDSWANILNAVDGSILWLIKSNEEVKYSLLKEAQRRKISSDRVIFSNRVSYLDYLARLKLADLYLDTFNYNAGATASDALRSGVPILTKIGTGYPARMASSLINAIGLNALITKTQKEYEAKAVELANNPQKLQKILSTLEQNKATSPLFNSALFTTNIETAYKIIYHNNIENNKRENIWIG